MSSNDVAGGSTRGESIRKPVDRFAARRRIHFILGRDAFHRGAPSLQGGIFLNETALAGSNGCLEFASKVNGVFASQPLS
jgi:hypothetical protein